MPDDPLNDKFSKETVQDFQNWEEYGYDDIPDYKTEYENYLPSDKMPDRQIAETPDFREELKKQFRFTELDESTYILADFIIDSLDESGFLTHDLETIAEEISFKQNIWVRWRDTGSDFKTIQQLDPLGCGSRNLGNFFEFSLLKWMENASTLWWPWNWCCIILTILHACNIEKIRRDMKMRDGEVKEVLQLLATLKTSPFTGSTNAIQANNTVFPDFIITRGGR